jgi:DNA-binding XRE family transcriptional regulator
MSAQIDLRAERHNRGLSAADAAEQIGINKQVLLDAETGRRPQPKNAFAIASFYGFKVTEIWPVEPAEAAA